MDTVRNTDEGPVLVPDVGKFHLYGPDGPIGQLLPETWSVRRAPDLYQPQPAGLDARPEPDVPRPVRDEFGHLQPSPVPTQPVLAGSVALHAQVPRYEMDLATVVAEHPTAGVRRRRWPWPRRPDAGYQTTAAPHPVDPTIKVPLEPADGQAGGGRRRRPEPLQPRKIEITFDGDG